MKIEGGPTLNVWYDLTDITAIFYFAKEDMFRDLKIFCPSALFNFLFNFWVYS